MSDTIPGILIVEDDKALQEVYQIILASQGYRIVVAGDGIDAMNQLNDFVPDIILLDYFMPRMDGKTFLQNLDQTKYPDMKIIVTSNASNQTVLDEMLTLGAVRVILKSTLSPTELIDVVSAELSPPA